MLSAKQIVNFTFSPDLFSRSGSIELTLTTKHQYEEDLKKLQEITDKVEKFDYDFKESILIPQVFRKFKALIRSGATSGLDKKELRTLTYSFTYSEYDAPSIFNQHGELRIALSFLQHRWKDSYLIGLFDCYLRNWAHPNTASFKILAEFIFQQLSNYKGERPALKALLKNKKFFAPANGDILLGSELALRGIPLEEATKYLGVPESWFNYPYFEKVIDTYYNKNKNKLAEILPEIESVLIQHTNNTKGARVSKMILSKIIIQCKEHIHEGLQDKVKDIAFNLIGDPANTGHWSPYSNATVIELKELKQAKDILNEWITCRFITVFFEMCINDPRRKKFWLKYYKVIPAFKVFGPSSIRSQLKRDQRIAKFVDSRFSVTSSQRQIAAIFMHVKNYKLIEFSDPGYAFYAYEIDNYSAPSIDGNYTSVDDLRDGTMPKLVYRKGFYLHSFSNEGRLTHNDGDMKWEEVFNEWINRKVEPNV